MGRGVRAREKAGVFRKHKPVILGLMDQRVRTFLSKAARIEGAEAITPFEPKGSSEAFFYREYEKLKLGLDGQHQLKNAAAVLEAVEVLRQSNFKITDEDIRRGLEALQLPGHLEKIKSSEDSQAPELLLDVAHNEESMESLVHYLDRNFLDRKKVFVLGMLKDKDSKRSLDLLKKYSSPIVVCPVASTRSMDGKDWEKVSKLSGQTVDFQPDLKSAIKKALELADQKTLVIIAGSVYLIGEVKACLPELWKASA